MLLIKETIAMGGGIKKFICFPKVLIWKWNVTPQVEFELAYYDVAVQHISHHTTGTNPITIHRVWWVNCHLNYTKMKMTLTAHFIGYSYQNYMKISRNSTDKIYLKKSLLASSLAFRWLQAFLMVSLFKLVNAVIILAFSSSWVLHSFVCLLLNCTPYIIFKGIAIWRVRWLDVVEENFAQSRLGSPACVAWCRVLLPNRVFQLPDSIQDSTTFSRHLM